MNIRSSALKAQRMFSRIISCSRAPIPVLRCSPTFRSSLVEPDTPAISTSVFAKSFSTHSGSDYGSQGLKAYPQYAVHGMTFLAMKLIPPTFKVVKNNILNVDNARKGRILFEFTPRGKDGKYDWTQSIRLALSAEEIGLLVNQLPHYKVEFSRVSSIRGDEPHSTTGSPDSPEKVLTVEPGELGVINFTIDYVKDGVGGQPSGPGQEGQGPLTCEIQAGEFEVLSSLLRESMPKLCGWSEMMDVAMKNAVEECKERTQKGRGGGGGGGGNFSSSGGVPLF